MLMVDDNQSIIDQSMTVIGEVKCSGRVIVKGKIDGILCSSTLIVGESGRIEGQITADEVECFGHIKGNVISDRFVMRKSGCHSGTVETRELEADSGSTIDCVLQSSVADIFAEKNSVDEEIQPDSPQVDLEKIRLIFDERERCCAMDVPWSQRKELLDQALNLLQKGKRLIKVTGNRGCGKTTFLLKLVEKLPVSTKLFVLSEPVGSVKDLLATIAAAMGTLPEEGESQNELAHRIKTAAGKVGREDKKIVLAIDDAQTMYPATIEGVIRCLTNLHGEDEELLQIILVGTDEIEGKLVDTIRNYFEDETNCFLALESLTIEDTADYLRFCLQIASKIDGAACMSLFPYETIKKLHTRSRGNIAEINQLVGKALLLASRVGATTVLPRFL
ncbi:MAG: hypothetical protein BA873_05280 [Desulfobulbaceae bacterium C00003063]|nr:MAG: hypothetical protein BA873_05280 [Desulfobulbaceae bacterium C00003063]